MSCPTEKTLISYVEGDVSETDEQRLSDHLSSCENCRQTRDSYEQLTETLREPERVSVDQAFVTRVMNEAEYLQSIEESPEPSRRSTEAGFRGFVLRNASWIASLSLHFSLFCLIALLVVSQFYGTEPADDKQDALTGIPVMKASDREPATMNFRSATLWRERFRRLRRAPAKGETGCPDESVQQTIQQTYDQLSALQNPDGSWGNPDRETERIQATALSVLALLRTNPFSDEASEERSRMVSDGLDVLVDAQEFPSGRIGAEETPIRIHATATAALLEAAVMSADPERANSGFDALDYLIRETPWVGNLHESGLWTFVSLRLGAAMGSPNAARLLRDQHVAFNSLPPNAKNISFHVLSRAFQPSSPDLPEEQKEMLRKQLQSWKETSSPDDLTRTPDFLALSTAVFAANDELRETWKQRINRITKKMDATRMNEPVPLARYVLILQSCRSYPE